MALDPSNPRSLVGATMGARKRAPPAANSPAAPVPGVDGARLDLHAQTPRGPLRPVEDEMSEIDVKEQIEARLERLAMESRQLAAMLERIAMPAEPKELGPPVTVRLGEPLVAIERRLIAATLVWCDFNKSEAADRLGISRRTIYNFLGELGAPVKCDSCQRTPGEGESWPVPTMCTRCYERRQREQLEARQQAARSLSDAGAAAILRRAAAGEGLTALADEYNTSLGCIKGLIAGRTYKHIPRPGAQTSAELTAEPVGAEAA